MELDATLRKKARVIGYASLALSYILLVAVAKVIKHGGKK